MTVIPDLLIRNALVFDGTGSEPAIKDIAVYAGRIWATGHNLPVNATRVVDADGLALMPGIIDSHTHFDAQITWDPTLKPSPALGVTTALRINKSGVTVIWFAFQAVLIQAAFFIAGANMVSISWRTL